MEAWQHVKLSLTNRSIGLISQRIRPAQQKARKKTLIPRPHTSIRQTHRIQSSNILKDTYGVSRRPLGRLVDLVVIARGPHPIPSRTRP